ncbi:MAG: hypothetical protein ACRCWI_04855 [Brevinema sp.]
MKNNILLSTLILAFLVGCTIESRKVFNLAYQEKQIVYTLDRGPFKSINQDGIFNASDHRVWDFNIEQMEISIYNVKGTDILDSNSYTFEVVEDTSAIEGVLRLYGNGPLNNNFVGVVALTNSHGAFLKLQIQSTPEAIIEQATQQSFWAYASDPILFRVHKNYLNQEIVSLDAEEFLPEKEYIIYVPSIRTLANGATQYVISSTEIFVQPDDSLIEGKKSEIILHSTRVIPLNTEIYEAEIDGAGQYVGIEFHPNPSNTKMKMIAAPSYDGAVNALKNQANYNRSLRRDALLNNKAIRFLKEHQIVHLVKPPTTGEYFWDQTDELIFDADNMKMRVITTLSILPPYGNFGATNILDYNIKLTKVTGTRSGIFKIEGATGPKFLNKFAAFNIIEEGNKVYFDMSLQDDNTAAQVALLDIMATPTKSYQDQKTATKPFRLGKNLHNIGEIWVRLNKSLDGGMSFDGKNTELFHFLDIQNNFLAHQRIQGGVSTPSFYKLEVVVDINDTNGVFLMHGYTDDTFTTPNPGAPLHGKYWAIERGSELYKTQAKFGIGNTITEAVNTKNSLELFNLHERRALPNDYRVIIHMETFKEWVAMTYTDNVGVPIADHGVVPTPLPPVGSVPVYFKYKTSELLFSTTSGSPKVTVTPFSGTVNNIITGTPATYDIETIEEQSPIYGVFKLKLDGAASPDVDWDGKYLSVRVETGAFGDRAYIAITEPPLDDKDPIQLETALNRAKDEIIRIFTDRFYNYHAKSSVPLFATFVKAIQGIRYIKSETDTTGTPNGIFIPYNTQYVSFSFTPLGMKVERITPNSSATDSDTYTLRMIDDGGDYKGIFQLTLQNRPLHNKFVRIDIQNGVDEKNNIRILIDDDVSKLADGVVAPIANSGSFTTIETTHKDLKVLNTPNTALTTMVAISTDWASIDTTDKLYDFKNHQLFRFDLANESVNIITISAGAEIRSENYGYLIVENEQTGADYGAVLLLQGPSTYNGQYFALTNTLHTFPVVVARPAVEGTKFSFGTSFNAAKNGLANKEPHLVPTDPLADTDVKNAFISLGMNTSTPPGFGTPSYVLLQNGAYDPRNTETWIFDPSKTNVTITHTSGQVVYDLYMLEGEPTQGAAPNVTRDTALFYLKSLSTGAHYNNTYVHVRDHVMIDTAGTDDSESTMNLVLHKNRTTVTDPTTPIGLTMKDSRSASISVPAIDLAAANLWMRLHDSEFQLNSAGTELWEFKLNGNAEIRITDQAGASHTYKYAPRENLSSHRGVFSLRSTDPAAPYNDHMVGIGIGGEPTPVPPAVEPGYNRGSSFDAHSMRLVILPIGANPVDTQRAVVAALNTTLPEWNFRTKIAAELHYNPAMLLNSIDDTAQGWVKLIKNTAGDYEYISTSTERWQFVESANRLVNLPAVGGGVASLVHDVLIEQSDAIPTQRHGIKLSTSGATSRRVEYQIFRANDGGVRSNQFVVLELGSGLNEKLMKVGTGATLAAARADFDATTGFNWSTYDRAIAGWGPVGVIDTSDKSWSLQRNDPNDITQDLGSAGTTTGNGHFNTTLTGSNKPSYNPNNSIDIVFDTQSQLMTVNYVVGNKTTPRIYSLSLVEEISPTEGVYLSQGGIGAFSGRFVYIETAEEPVNGDFNRGKRGRMSVAGTLNEVKMMNQALKTAGTWNFFESDWTRVSDIVFAEANKRHAPTTTLTDPQGAYVELGFSEVDKPNVYDPKLVVTYTFIPTRRTINGVDYLSDRTVIISNVSPTKTRDDVYTYEIQEVKDTAGQDLRSYALLNGSGPDGGKTIGIRLPRDNTSAVAVAIIGTPTEVRNAIQWTVDNIDPTTTTGNDTYRYSTLKSVESKSKVLEELTKFNGMVTLDSDSIYVDNNTTEWSFAIDSTGVFQATTIERRLGVANRTTTYNIVKVVSQHEDDGAAGITTFKGILFLKGAGSLNRNYIGVVIEQIAGAQAIKLYPFASTGGTATPASAFASAEQVLTGTGTYNFVEKSVVHFPNTEPIVNALIAKGEWISLNSTSFAYLPANQITNLRFKNGREVDVKIGNNAAVTGRFKVVWDEVSLSKTILQFINKGTTVLPLDFANSYFAIDLMNTADSDGMKALKKTGININTVADRDQLIADRDNLRDPTYIPKTLFDIRTDALATLFDVSPSKWRQVADEQGNLAGAAHAGGTVAWTALYNANKDTAPWNYDLEKDANNYYSFKITRGTSNKPENESSLEAIPFQYQLKMISDGGANDAIYRLYGASPVGEPQPFYQSEISNRFHAIRIGTGSDHFRMKTAYGSTLDEAMIAINSLAFFNMSAQELWKNTSTVWISNMNVNTVNGDNVTVLNNGWGEWVDMTSGTGFDIDNHDYWSFVHNEGSESIVYSEVRAGTVTSYSYGLRLMTREDKGGFYTLIGFGPHNGRILIYQRGALNVTDIAEKTGASFFITTAGNNDYNSARAGFNAQFTKPGNAKYNWVERRTLRESIGVLEAIVNNNLGTMFSIDSDAYAKTPSINVYNKRDHRSLQFSVNTTDITATVNAVDTVNGSSTSVLYNAIPQKTALPDAQKNIKGVVLLNAAPANALHGKIFAVQLKTTDKKVIFKEYATVAAAEAVIIAGDVPEDVNSIYVLRESVSENYSPALEGLEHLGSLVDLDKDTIYLDHDTLEYAFDSTAGTVLISTRSDVAGVTVQKNDTYFFNEIKGLTPFTGGANPAPDADGKRRALFLLKGTRGSANPLHNKLLAIQFNTINDKTLVGKQVLITDDRSAVSDALLDARPMRTAVKTGVLISEDNLSIFEKIIHPTTGIHGLGVLHPSATNFTYNPSATETLWIDQRQRIIYHENSFPGAGTNFVRFTFSNLTDSTARQGKRLVIQFLSNTRDDLFFRGDQTIPTYVTGTARTGIKTPNPTSTTLGGASKVEWSWAFGLGDGNLDTTGIFLGYETNNISQAISNLDNGTDPKMVPLRYLRNTPEVLDTIYNQIGDTENEWYIPVDANRAPLPDLGEQNFAFRIPQRTAVTGVNSAVYDFRYGIRTGLTTVGSSKANMLTKIIRNDGANDGVLLPHTFNFSRLSNKYVALRYGMRENETKVKMAVADTEAEAIQQLNTLSYWNYVQKTTLEAQARVISNMAISGTTRHTWVQFASTVTNPSYSAGDTIDWTFDEARLVLTIYTVVASTTNADTYRLQTIKDEATHKGVFLIVGAGNLGQKFIALDNSTAVNATNTKAWLGVGDTITDAIRNRDTANSTSRYALFRKDTILSVGVVMSYMINHFTAGDASALQFTVSNFVRGVNLKDSFEYKYYMDRGDARVRITTRTKGVARTDDYLASQLPNPSGVDPNWYGFYRISGPGIDNGQILGIRLVSSNLTYTHAAVISGRTKAEMNQPGTGTIPNTVAGVHAVLSATNVEYPVGYYEPNHPLYSYNVLNMLSTMGDIVELSGGKFNPVAYRRYTFNAAANSLVIISKNGLNETREEYNIMLNVDTNAMGATTSERAVFYLQNLNGTFPAAPHMAIALIKDGNSLNPNVDYRAILVVDQNPKPSYDSVTTILGTATSSPYSYWTHEKFSSVNIVHDRLKDLETLAKPKAIWSTSDGTLNGTLSTKTYSNLVFLADDRLFKNNGTGTSRIKKGNAGLENKGGYFEPKDTYVWKFGFAYDAIEIQQNLTNASGTIQTTSQHFTAKVLESTDNLVVIQLIQSTGSNRELQTLFGNMVLAIDLGSRRERSDNVKIGYARPAGATKAQMTAAITAAKADLQAQLNGLLKYTPNVISQAQAYEQHRSLMNIGKSGMTTRMFTDSVGQETVAPEFSYSAQQIGGTVDVGNNNAYGNNTAFHFILGLKAHSDQNNTRPGHDSERYPTTRVGFMINVVQTDGLDTMIFRFHRPNDTSHALVSTTGWSNLMFNKYHAIQAGRGAFLGELKWVYADTPEEARVKLALQPFYNNSYEWIAPKARREFMGSLIAARDDVWVQRSFPKSYQSFSGNVYTRNWRFSTNTVGGKTSYTTRISDYNSLGQFCSSYTYELRPKELQTGVRHIWTLNNEFAPHHGQMVAWRRSGSTAKMLIVGVSEANQENLVKLVQQFTLGGTSGPFDASTKELNIKHKSSSSEGFVDWN